MNAPMSETTLRVLAIAERPAQYQAPLFRRMAARKGLDLHVAYCTLRGAEAAHDSEFGATVQWDVPLLDGYAWTQVPNRGSGAETFWGLRNPGLWQIIREGQFDAVLCYVSYRRASFWIARAAARFSGAAFLFGTDASSLAPRNGRKWKYHLKRATWPILLRLADQIFVPSTNGVELMKSLGLARDRVTLTPYVVDNDWWLEQSARVDRAATRVAWGVEPDDSVVLFCAKLQPWKRPLDLLRAFAKARIARTHLVFAGEGPQRAQLEAESTALGVSHRVRFLGFVNQTQLPAIYTASDLLVLPSEYEPFGVVVNESMLCGCPVVASDHVGAARDLIAPGNAGFVYSWGDIDALADVLRQALADRTKLSDMARAARRRMESWSPDENIDATLEAITRGIARLRHEKQTSDTASRMHDSAPPVSHKVPE
jgi:glycosyltransferase involved in cell wall biosynthesis